RLRSRYACRPARSGVRGCRVQDRFPGGVDVHAMPHLARRVAGVGWPIEIWTDVRAHLDWLPQAVATAATPVVFDHFGFLPAAEAPDEAPVRELLAMVRRGWRSLARTGSQQATPKLRRRGYCAPEWKRSASRRRTG
ncbi:MAG: hypothetical protein ACRDRN_14880, partial [Sciscionella sp.]